MYVLDVSLYEGFLFVHIHYTYTNILYILMFLTGLHLL